MCSHVCMGVSCSDVEKIQAGIGDKLVLFINSITTFIAGFVIAFTFSWKMALVMCCVLPIIVAISSIIAKVWPGRCGQDLGGVVKIWLIWEAPDRGRVLEV